MPNLQNSWERRENVATPPAPYRSLPGPPGPESRKSLKRVSRGLPALGSKKCPKQSRNSLRSLKINCFETPETVSKLFRTLLGLPAPGDSCKGPAGLQEKTLKKARNSSASSPKTKARSSKKSKERKIREDARLRWPDSQIRTNRLILANCFRGPDPPILAFLEKARVFSPRKQGFFSSRNPYNPWKREENRTEKQGKSENEKARKSKKARIGGSGGFPN